mgnify:CR=1 FL=1
MTKQELDYIVGAVINKQKVEFALICETQIRNSMLKMFRKEIVNLLLNNDSLKPLITECFSLEAEKIIKKEMKRMSFPLTVKQISALTGLSEAAIYQRKHRGQMNFEKQGSRIFISLDQLNSLFLNRLS